jgi:DNA-directed RNA polymerase specialized sigma24 family protein
MKRVFLSEREEEALVDSVLKGHEGAWGTLYHSLVLPIRGFIASRVGSIDDAEDLAEECFIRARRSLSQGLFDRQYRLYTLLRSTALHLVQDYWRHRVRAEERLPDHSIPEPHSRAHQRTFFEPLERLELLRLVFVCGAKPPQVLAFGFVKLLEWRPREMAQEHRASSLRNLRDDFLACYYAPLEQFLSKRIFYSTYCSPLSEAVESPVREVYVEHEYCSLGANPDSTVGDLALEVFFGRDPAANISDWCDRVKTRTRKLISATNMEANNVTQVQDPGC